MPTLPPTKQDATKVLYPPGISVDGIAKEWEKVLADNQAIPKDSLCKLPEAVLHIHTGDARPIWLRQYPIPPAYLERVKARFQLWQQ